MKSRISQQPLVGSYSNLKLKLMGSNQSVQRYESMSGCSVEMFKKAVDDFLADQPTVSGLTRAATTNSLIDQLAMQVGTTTF